MVQSFACTETQALSAHGLRHREDVEQLAAQADLALRKPVAMPANPLLLVWGRRTRA